MQNPPPISDLTHFPSSHTTPPTTQACPGALGPAISTPARHLMANTIATAEVILEHVRSNPNSSVQARCIISIFQHASSHTGRTNIAEEIVATELDKGAFTDLASYYKNTLLLPSNPLSPFTFVLPDHGWFCLLGSYRFLPLLSGFKLTCSSVQEFFLSSFTSSFARRG
jgi:hypothetical protein